MKIININIENKIHSIIDGPLYNRLILKSKNNISNKIHHKLRGKLWNQLWFKLSNILNSPNF